MLGICILFALGHKGATLESQSSAQGKGWAVTSWLLSSSALPSIIFILPNLQLFISWSWYDKGIIAVTQTCNKSVYALLGRWGVLAVLQVPVALQVVGMEYVLILGRLWGKAICAQPVCCWSNCILGMQVLKRFSVNCAANSSSLSHSQRAETPYDAAVSRTLDFIYTEIDFTWHRMRLHTLQPRHTATLPISCPAECNCLNKLINWYI